MARAERTHTAPRPRLLAWRQWPRETRDTLFLLAVIGWTVGPHLLHLPGWCAALTGVVLVWRATIALQGGALPGRGPVVVALGAALVLTLITERTLLGREAGVTMLVVLMALKTLELRARRDAVVVFFLGFFLVLTQCLYSQSLLMALAMLVATWGLLTALVLANLPVGRPTLARAGGVAARSALLGLPVMVVLFLLFPRFGPLWGLPEDGAGRTGLSGSLRLGGVAELANDDSVAFQVRFTGGLPPTAEQLYFRGPVLSRFDGLDWQQGPMATVQHPGRRPDLEVIGPALPYELRIEPSRLSLLALLEATSARPGDAPSAPDWQLWQGPDLVWRTDRPVTEPLRLSARAHTDHRHGLSMDPDELQALTLLPEGFNPRTRLWARELQARLGGTDPRTLVSALLAYIGRQPYVYTLTPGVYGRDAVDEFWLDRREGFCEHYATALVVVLRNVEVPARVVTGYQGAEPPDANGWRTVRQSHAHAWAEYWQPGAGWVRVDPTAAVAPERVRSSRPLAPRSGLMADALRTMNPALADRLRRAWEQVDTRWTQWVMGWSRTRQFDLLRSLGVPQPHWSDLARALVCLLVLGAAGGAAWALHDRRRQDPWQRLQHRLVSALRRAGVDAQPHQPLRTLAALVRAHHGSVGAPLADALEALDRRRHGPTAPAGRPAPEATTWPMLWRLARRLPRHGHR